jgi:hypothetical protein
VWCNGEVGHNFVGETQWRLLVPKNDHWRICAMRQNVDEIDPRGKLRAMPMSKDRHGRPQRFFQGLQNFPCGQKQNIFLENNKNTIFFKIILI